MSCDLRDFVLQNCVLGLSACLSLPVGTTIAVSSRPYRAFRKAVHGACHIHSRNGNGQLAAPCCEARMLLAIAQTEYLIPSSRDHEILTSKAAAVALSATVADARASDVTLPHASCCLSVRG